VIELPLLVDVEGWGFLLMKGAEAEKVFFPGV
jgi:hypothetical protein